LRYLQIEEENARVTPSLKRITRSSKRVYDSIHQ